MRQAISTTAVIVSLGIGLAPHPAAAQGQGQGQGQQQPLTVELNKFEAGEEGGCRAFFLFRNEDDRNFDDFEMSLAVLDSQGVIDRLLTVDAAPLPAGRTTLKLFEIPGIGCEAISEILLHDMTACNAQNEGPEDCFGLMKLVSRTSARFVD